MREALSLLFFEGNASKQVFVIYNNCMDPFVERDKSSKSKSGPYTGPLLLLRSDWWCGFLSSWDAAGIHPGIKPSEAVKPAPGNSEERSGIRVLNISRDSPFSLWGPTTLRGVFGFKKRGLERAQRRWVHSFEKIISKKF